MSTDNTQNGSDKLQGAFGDRGTNVNAISYGHPHADKIIEEACAVIGESDTGRKFLNLITHQRVAVHIMKGTGESGYSPDMNTIFLQVPGKIDKATPEHIIILIKALYEATDELGGASAPDPLQDVMAYASFIHGRNIDSITIICKILKELTNSSSFSVLLDSLTKLGLNEVYKAYVEGGSRDQLYEKYAEAYDKQIEGVI
ncbi:MAG: hypothetical protein MRY79_07670 [Alphaproteobacteria bacterium]|nr:hypothetical protein [Alphaproteobacteria bacterium]